MFYVLLSFLDALLVLEWHVFIFSPATKGGPQNRRMSMSDCFLRTLPWKGKLCLRDGGTGCVMQAGEDDGVEIVSSCAVGVKIVTLHLINDEIWKTCCLLTFMRMLPGRG